MGIASGISALGSLGSGFMTSNAAAQAGQAQAQASENALLYQGIINSQTQAQFRPYRQLGKQGENMLAQQLPSLTQQFNPTEAQLQSTPGYQFDLSQGLQATQNSAAARGLGVSGAALKGASSYATGLADNTLQTQFNINQQNEQNAYNKLAGVTGLGESAVGSGAQVAASTGSTAANALLAGGQAQAQASIAQNTAFNPLLSNASSYYMMANLGNSGAGFGGFGNTSLPNNTNGQLIGFNV